MIEYIKKLADTTLLCQKGNRPAYVHNTVNTYELLADLRDELNRLDPRDFEPDHREAFIVARAAIKKEAVNPMGPRSAANPSYRLHAGIGQKSDDVRRLPIRQVIRLLAGVLRWLLRSPILNA